MQQLEIEHKNTKKDRRPGKGRTMALSRHIYRLQNTDNTVYYVESETSDNNYYLVKFKPDGSLLEGGWYCSCKDNSTRRGLKCKHIWGIEFAIKWGTIKDIEKLHSKAKYYPTTTTLVAKSYMDDDYSF